MSTANRGGQTRNVFRTNRPQRRRTREMPLTRLRVEALEERQMLSGVASLTPVAVQPLGLVADTYESDNSLATAKTITVNGAAQTHNIHVQGDADFVKFTLAATSSVIITTSGTVGDTELRLYSSTAAQLAYNNDSSGTFSRIAASNLAAGTYYVKVNEYGNNAVIASYSLAITATATLVSDAYEADNTLATAKTFAVNSTTQAHSIHTVGDQDWITFTLATPTNVLLATTGTAGDTELTLYDASGTQLAYNNDSNGTFARITANNLATGTYYAKVNEYGNNATIAFYTLAVTGTAVMAPDAYEVDNTLATAKTITVNDVPQTHSIHNLGDQDWVKFTLSSITNLVITSGGVSGNTSLSLYKASGTRLAYNNDSSGTFARIAVSNLAVGTYYAKVNEYGDDSTIAAYTLAVTGTTAATNASETDRELAPAHPTAAQAHTIPATSYLLCDAWGGTWCDAEKNAASTDDDLLCWAATAANMLAWTGWGNADGMSTTDSIFSYFEQHWTDQGGHPAYGIGWWFEGTNPMQDVSGWTQVEAAGGGFFAGVDWASYLHYSSTLATAMSTLAGELHAGCAVGLGLGGPGGHAVTCWGYTCDTGDRSNFNGVYLTDSDDQSGADGLKYYAVALSEGRWYLQDYCGRDDWYIADVTGLKPRPSAVGGVTALAAVAAQPTPGLLTDETSLTTVANHAFGTGAVGAEDQFTDPLQPGLVNASEGATALVVSPTPSTAFDSQPAQAKRLISDEPRNEPREDTAAILAGESPAGVRLAAIDTVLRAFA